MNNISRKEIVVYLVSRKETSAANFSDSTDCQDSSTEKHFTHILYEIKKFQ